MPAVLPIIAGVGLGVQALGMFQQGAAASAQAKGQQAVAEYNARVAEQQAKSIEQQTAYKQQLQSQEAARIASSQRAAMGASGAVISEGTPLMIQAKQAAQAELDQLMTGYTGQTAAGQARSQGAIDTLQAGIYGQQARSASKSGLIGAGTSLLSGFGKLGYDLHDKGWPT
jgi:hypothetical protein